jgi:surface carbohydrate biosynthesis protein
MGFFLHLIKRVFYFGLTSKSLLSAIIDTVDAKVVLTFVDNNPVMGELDLIYPDKLIVAIQNGIRRNNVDSLVLNSHDRVPTFFGFGEQQKYLMLNKRISYREYFPIGSVKMGLFLEDFKHLSKMGKNGICFISQYIKDWDNSKNPAYKDSNVLLKVAFNNTLEWCVHNGLECNVALRNSKNHKNYRNELNFFSSTNTSCHRINFFENNVDLYSSYKVAYNSKVIISNDSTLAFEMFGFGIKVLFFSGMLDKRYTIKKGQNELFSKLPSFLVVKSLKENLFMDQLNYLNNMDTKEYLTKTKLAREYFMVNNERTLPHKVISNYIGEFLKKNNV